MAPARVIGTIRGDGITRFVWRDLLQQFRQQGVVSLAARSELERADIARARVPGDMDLAPLPAARRTMLANLPLAVASEFDAGAIDQEVQRLPGCTIRDLNRDPRLASAERRTIRHRPIEPGHPDQAFDQPGRLAKRKTEENFQRQEGLDRGIREGLGSSRTSPRARPCRDQTTPTASLAYAARLCRLTSSACDSGERWASACASPALMDSLRESIPRSATTPEQLLVDPSDTGT